MLKTAATRMYWKQEIKNRTVFSRFLACNLVFFPLVDICRGGSYLRNGQSDLLYAILDIPFSPSDPKKCPSLNRTCNDDLANYAGQHLLRHETGGWSLEINSGEG